MHLYKTMKSFLLDQNYFIDMWENYIHVYGLVDIDVLGEKQIVLILEKFKLNLKGQDFRVLKLTKQEILIQGILEGVNILYGE